MTQNYTPARPDAQHTDTLAPAQSVVPRNPVAAFASTWARRIITPQMAIIAALTLAASLAGAWLKRLPVLSLFGSLIIALLIGMALQAPVRRLYVAGSENRGAGVRDAAGLISNKLLRLGIILLGFKLNLSVLFTQGLVCLPIAAVGVTLTIVVCYRIARRLGVEPDLAILVAGGTGICGAAAVMGLSGSITVPPGKERSKADHQVMAVAIVAIMGTIFALVEIALGPLTGLTSTQLGVMAGASLHEIAHAVAAGDAFGAVDISTIMKLSRVLMLVVASGAICVWWNRRHAEDGAHRGGRAGFPWFMLGFIGASVAGTYVPGLGAAAPMLVSVAYIVLGMAMAALGLTVNVRAIAKEGRAAFLASVLTSVLLVGYAGLMAWLFF